jgi:3-oxoacyl-[acyl-carrier-protein] synthase-3
VDGGVDAVVYATDTFWQPEATKGPARLLEALGCSRTPLYGAALHECGNLGAALHTARATVAAGLAHDVLVLTTDVCRPGGRLMGGNLSVLSDGAASCLVGTARPDSGFRLIAMQTAVEGAMHRINITTDTIAVVKATSDGLGRASKAAYVAAGVQPTDAKLLVTNNYGRSSLRIFAASVGMGFDKVYHANNADIGHCFAADVLIDLEALRTGGDLRPGDLVVALMTGTHAWTCAAFEYVES